MGLGAVRWSEPRISVEVPGMDPYQSASTVQLAVSRLLAYLWLRLPSSRSRDSGLVAWRRGTPSVQRVSPSPGDPGPPGVLESTRGCPEGPSRARPDHRRRGPSSRSRRWPRPPTLADIQHRHPRRTGGGSSACPATPLRIERHYYRVADPELGVPDGPVLIVDPLSPPHQTPL